VKLVRIEHERCQEPDGTTWCFAPDDWDQERFEKAVFAAKRAYQVAMDAYMEEAKKQGFPAQSYGWSAPPNYASYPDLTVKEGQERHKAEEDERKRKREIALAGTHNFAWFLEQEGLVQFHRADADLYMELDWGHQHGRPLDYQQKSAWELDKQGIGKTDDD